MTNHPPVALVEKGEALNTAQQFTYYLKSTLAVNCNFSVEIQTRIRLISAAFGRLPGHVFHDRNLTISTKTAVYTVRSAFPFSRV